MHLAIRNRNTKTGKRQYVTLETSYRDQATGKPRVKVVETLGWADEIEPERLEALKQKYSSEKSARQRKQSQQHRVAQTADKILKYKLTDHIFDRYAPKLRYGHLLIKRLWEREYGLDAKFDYEQENNTSVSAYSLNDVAFYYTAMKLISPGSHLQGFEEQSTFLLNPIYNIALDNIYEGLEQLGMLKDQVMACMGRKIRENQGPASLVFYDCTNFYFETPFDDEVHFRRQYARKRARQMRSHGFSEDAVRQHLTCPEYLREVDNAVIEISNQLIRKRGASKEHRLDLPIASFALVIDDRGFPLDFQVYPGNVSEFKSMEESIDKLKDKYHIQNAYVVADRGLNSAANLAMLKEKGLGFVVAQKVTSQKPQVRAQMLDPTGYKTFKDLSEDEQQAVSGLVEDLGSTRFKVCDHLKKALTTNENGETVEVEVKCKIMFTFNNKRKARDLSILSEDEAKARRAVAGRVLMGGKNLSGGWRSLVLTQQESKKRRKDKDLYRAEQFNYEALQKRKEIAGYAAIVFSPSPEHEEAGESITHKEVLSTYHHLVRIEECFRIMKHNFELRPVYVRKPYCITGHCLMCILALIMLRTLEIKLSALGAGLSVSRICQALADAELCAVSLAPNKEVLVNQRCFRLYSREFHRRPDAGENQKEILSHEEMAALYLDHMQKEGTDLELLLRSLDLEGPKKISTLRELLTSLRLRPRDKRCFIDPVYYKFEPANEAPAS